MMKANGNSAIVVGAALLLATAASAETFSIPGGTLASALDAYSAQSGVPVAISAQELDGARSRGVSGDMSAETALVKILSGTGFTVKKIGDSIAIVRTPAVHSENIRDEFGGIQLAAAQAAPAALETVTVTSSKLGGADVQSIPIAITALSQEQLTATQTAGGPDLIKQVPNMTFTKTNFTGYNIEIRGIGTQAISVTTDPAVAVALNDIPFIRNHFFEQEFYDLGQAEVLRGPQGTLYGRNATAGVVDLVTAKPTDQFEAMASADIGNYENRRFEGMVNVPIIDDRLDIRVAGEWTKRDGYTFNETTGKSIDGRDLWSGRATIGWKPLSNLQTYLVWEHFSEDDDRLNSGKQLCEKDPGLATVTDWNGNPVSTNAVSSFGNVNFRDMTSQGCLPTSLYSPSAFETPNGNSIPFVIAGQAIFATTNPDTDRRVLLVNGNADPYGTVAQSPSLRVIQSELTPTYKVKNDTLEFNADYKLGPALTLTSQTGYNSDFEATTQDFNNFNSAPGLFADNPAITPNGVFCDPQLGCSNKLVGEDMSLEHAWQLSQEFRLASNFPGPLNFSIGGNYLHYETDESFYVFANLVTLIADAQNLPGDAANYPQIGTFPNLCAFYNNEPIEHVYSNPKAFSSPLGCTYIDPNPIGHLDNEGHNYFLNQNPYVLNSYAGFGEAYYQLLPDLKLTAGLRWTDDQKHFVEIPSWIAVPGWGYPIAGAVDQKWGEPTGRLVADWTPNLDFTDQTLIYASYSRGYKAGGANPPPPTLAGAPPVTHPLTFNPEFINAYEAGIKNAMDDGAITFNGDVFYYDYKGYQISEIVDRDAINLNIDATVKGAELESTWEPVPGLKFTFTGGYEKTRIANGTQEIDLMDRTAGHPGWAVFKPPVTETSNCVLPDYVVAALVETINNGGRVNNAGFNATEACFNAYAFHQDPVSGVYALSVPGYPGYDPLSPNATNAGAGPAPNNGAGFDKNLGGNELPNAPHFTASLSAEYTLPLSVDWAATLHGDYYWQDNSWARIFNDDPYDRIHGYSNVNTALILSNTNGWQVMGYVKNIFNTTAITGAFLYSDDVGLTTNVFLTDPRLFGVRVTKNF